MRWTALMSFVFISACGAEVVDLTTAAEDGEFDEAFTGGKTDDPFSGCQLVEMLRFVNDPETTSPVLKAAGVHSRAASAIVAHRNGDDGKAGTADDDLFDDPEELDAVSWVGPVAFRALATHVEDRCTSPVTAPVELIFSPQPYESSHLARVATLIDAAERSIDIAMYSYRDKGLTEALKRAIARGVSVRMIFEAARKDKSKPEGTTSAALETAGIDVRYVTKIMHHKFAIFDGPRTSPAEAAGATLVTGSANWSSSAATRYDENTLVLRGQVEATLRFQAEFNRLWTGSREFVWNESLTAFDSAPIDETAIADDPAFDVAFTSANFQVKPLAAGPSWSLVPGKSAVADRLVALIQGAKTSIHIASGHLRSRPVSEALIAKHAADPSVDIRVYLDGQEYLSKSSHDQQMSELDACLTAAGDDAGDQQACADKGFLFSLAVKLAGIDLRYKYYAYRWDNSYAAQMHHKYFLFDGTTVASGSYNLSDNAEHETFENMAIYESSAFPEVAAAFEANFETLWRTGEDAGKLGALQAKIAAGGSIPIVFDAMALTWDQVTALKKQIRTACPAVDSQEYRENAPAHFTCTP